MPNSNICRETISFLAILLLLYGVARGAEHQQQAAPKLASEPALELPLERWSGFHGEIEGVDGKQRAAVGYPAGEARPLAYRGIEPALPGVYELRLKLGASHVADAVAWGGVFELCDSGNDNVIETFSPLRFSRVNQPQWRSIEWIRQGGGPLQLELSASVDAEVFKAQQTKEEVAEKGWPDPTQLGDNGVDDLDVDLPALEFKPDPRENFYCILYDAELHLLSASGVIDDLMTDKILYSPGETLTAEITAHSMADAASGKLQLFIEWGLDNSELVQEIPVRLGRDRQTISAKVKLSDRELGHALLVRFVSDDGRNVHEKRRFFNVATNFQRVAMPGFFGHPHNFGGWSEERARLTMATAARNYYNYWEWFAWAEEDMVELSPEDDYWFSGQTSYHGSKAASKQAVKAAHEFGIKVVTYGKFVMSGFLGWDYAYSFPNDCKNHGKRSAPRRFPV